MTIILTLKIPFINTLQLMTVICNNLSLFVAATKDESEVEGECRGRQNGGSGARGKLPYNGYSEECLDRLEPNGNIPNDKDSHYG